MEAIMLHRSRLSLLAATLLTGFFTAAPAFSQNATGPPCVDRSVVIEFLLTHYGERIEARGLSSAGYMVEIYVAPSQSWTIVATPPVGQSCVLAQGVAWDYAAPREQSARR
jgi:hypothetical protein